MAQWPTARRPRAVAGSDIGENLSRNKIAIIVDRIDFIRKTVHSNVLSIHNWVEYETGESSLHGLELSDERVASGRDGGAQLLQ